MAKRMRNDGEFEEVDSVSTPDTDAAIDELEHLREENALLKSPKGIPTIETAIGKKRNRNADGTLKRDEQILREKLRDAVRKRPQELTEEDKVSLEREIRRYIKRGGVRKDIKGNFYDVAAGYRKGITAEQKARCDEFLRRLGRTDAAGKPKLEWDISISVPGFEEV